MSQTGPSPEQVAERVTRRLMQLPQLLERVPRAGPMREHARFDCLVGTPSAGVHLSVRRGRIVEAGPGPALMRSWDFALRAAPEAWEEHWRDLPRAGFHDILAMAKRGAATVEGDFRVFLANLQFVKDLVALPRGGAGAAAGVPNHEA